MIYTNENWKPPVTYCEPNKVEVQRMTREEAIDCLEGLKIYLKTEHIDQEAVDMAIEALKQEPRKGKWVGLDECSVCGKQAYDFIEGCVDGVEYLPNFCPNCGAKMDKE